MGHAFLLGDVRVSGHLRVACTLFGVLWRSFSQVTMLVLRLLAFLSCFVSRCWLSDHDVKVLEAIGSRTNDDGQTFKDLIM
eukprot:2003734-Amphidinium_carterae.1